MTYRSALPTEYAPESSTHWSRIDMLLDIYQKAIDTIEKLLDACSNNDTVTAIPLRIQAISIIALIESGVDVEYWEQGQDIIRLCQFVSKSLTDGDVDSIRSSLGIVKTIREGFEGIRTEAIEMEFSGQIPALELEPTVEIEV